MRGGRRAHEVGVAQGGGAEDHAPDPAIQPGLDGGAVADAAAELHRDGHRGEDRLDRGGVHRPAGEGAVEVDEMQPFAARALEGEGLGGGVLAEDGGAGHVAAQEPHAAAVLEVDGGVEDHAAGLRGDSDRQGRQVRKFAISRSPVAWLFSGWNWVPMRLSRPTTAVTGPPCSTRASTCAGSRARMW